MRKTIKALLYIAVICVLLAVASALSYRFGILSITNSFSVFGALFFVGAGVLFATALILLIQILRRKREGLSLAFTALIISFFFSGYLVVQWNKTTLFPPVHDISTDVDNPPMFTETVVSLRGKQSNSVQMSEQAITANKGFYTDINPLVVQGSLNEVYAQALNVARDQGWDIHTQDESNGVIEATDTTLWMGFKDDVAIRLTEVDSTPPSTKIDIRSISRIGMSDIGVNAARIRDYMQDLEEITTPIETEG